MPIHLTSAISQLDPTFTADSLPYHDGLITKEEKEAASKLIDEGLKRFPKSKDYLTAAGFVEDYEKLMTPAMKEILVMADRNLPLDAIDDSRFIIPDVEAIDKDPAEALKALELVEAQIMYTDERRNLMSLIQKHGSADYRIVSAALKTSGDAMARLSTEAKRATFDVHHERRSEQKSFGERIAELEAAFDEGYQKVNNLRDVVAASRADLERQTAEVENTDPASTSSA
uniref:Pre-mRNA-splicing factor SPF27 n=1 Tax=Panagrellus redivivus TaxID=6233 RepID=A0A7E4VT14_PANRE